MFESAVNESDDSIFGQIGEPMSAGELEYYRSVLAVKALASRLVDQIGDVDEVMGVYIC